MKSVTENLVKTGIMMMVFMTLHSCCKHNKETIKEDAIRMGVIATNISTKAVIDSLPDLVSLSYNDGTDKIGFGVYGCKITRTPDTNQESLTYLFENTEVLPSTNQKNTDWTYATTRYWDSNPNVSYQFMAYWPHLNTTTSIESPYISATNRTVTLHNIPNWQDEATAKDYLYATNYGRYVGPDGYKENYQGKVYFTFRHLLSRLRIQAFYVGSLDDTITVTKLTLKQSAGGRYDVLDQGSTTFNLDYSLAGNTPYQDASTANDGNPADFGSLYYLMSGVNKGIPKRSYVDDTSADTIHTMIGSWLMMPHVWNGVKLEVGYKVGLSEAKTSSPIAISLGNTSTQSGMTYVLTLKFNSAGEEVYVESVFVRDWVEETVEWGFHNW